MVFRSADCWTDDKLVRSKVSLMYNRGPKRSKQVKYNIQLLEVRETKAKYQQSINRNLEGFMSWSHSLVSDKVEVQWMEYL